MTGVDGAERSGGDVARLLAGSVLDVAPRLLGCLVSTEIGGILTQVSVAEVEAYAGPDDPASHAFRGRTSRNAPMFEAAGTLYVYRSYGLHWCMNIVVGDEGEPHAVLLRGGIPTIGRDEMIMRRGRTDHIADGPGKLCQALAVTGDHTGTSVFDGPVRLRPGRPPTTIARTPRIGISVATNRRWRFVGSDAA